MKPDNGEVRLQDKLLPNTAIVNETGVEPIAPKRTSHITIGLKRTLSTAQFETLVIELATEEDIEWTTPVERQTKLRNWHKLFVDEFKQAHDRILDELQLSHKKAYFKNATEETIKRYRGAANNDSEASREDLNDLDILK